MIDVEKIKENITDLAKKHNLLFAVLFGSQVTGKTHSQSDVDIAFLSERKMSLLDVAKMQEEFLTISGIKNIELVSLNDASPFLLKQIAEKSIVLYERDFLSFARFKIYSFKRFMEAKNLFDLRALSFNKFLQKI